MDLHQHSEMCECDVIHEEAVAHVRQVLEDTEVLYAVLDFFKVMSDSARMRIMAVLDSEELCVCDISELLGMTKSAVSHQLKVLKDARLVKFRCGHCHGRFGYRRCHRSDGCGGHDR